MCLNDEMCYCNEMMRCYYYYCWYPDCLYSDVLKCGEV
jgi:hypothetical protein